jgi:hypothetical protein
MTGRMHMEKKLLTKKCPYCSVVLGINDTICFSCRRKVGKINEHGLAEKPFDWLAYLLCFLSIGAFVYFIWWSFFRK